jgi:hypothetical protein
MFLFYYNPFSVHNQPYIFLWFFAFDFLTMAHGVTLVIHMGMCVGIRCIAQGAAGILFDTHGSLIADIFCG